MLVAWPVILESVIMVALWVTVVVLSMLTTLSLLIGIHALYLLFFVGLLGFLHFCLNVWLVSLLRGNFNKIGLAFLAVTQTTPFFLLCRKAFFAMRAGCEKDPTAKQRKVLKAKYGLTCEINSSDTQLPDINEEHTYGSCVPGHSSELPVSSSNGDITNSIELPNLSPVVKVTNTKFQPNTKTVKLSFDTPEEIYSGEPNIYKFVVRNLQTLYFEEKRLSYHIITNSSNAIIYVSKSSTCAEQLPERVIRQNPTTVCNDTHYIVNFIKSLGYQTTGVTKRVNNQVHSFTHGDLTKLVWLLVWPTTVIIICGAIEVLQSGGYGYKYPFAFATSTMGVITWMVTQRTVDDPWRNTCILVFLRLCFTVCRTVLVLAMLVTWVPEGVLVIVTAKTIGLLSLAGYIAYAKAVKNVELFGDAAVKYSFNPMYEPVVQVSESIVYCCWAVGWHLTTPTESPASLILMLVVVVSHVWGLAWLWFMRNFLKDPLTDPTQVLQLAKDRELTRNS